MRFVWNMVNKVCWVAALLVIVAVLAEEVLGTPPRQRQRSKQ